MFIPFDHSYEHHATLSELAWVFFKLGATAFGGPAAHIGLMEYEVVRRRGWLSHGEFLDLLGATNLIPGPNSTEMAIHIGWQQRRWPGLLIAGLCFIVPSTMIVLAMAWAYVRFGARAEASGLLHGIKPVIIAVIAQALWRLGSHALKGRLLIGIALLATVANLLGADEILVLLGAGLLVAVARRLRRIRRGGQGTAAGFIPWLLWPILQAAGPVAALATAAATPFGLLPLFLFFVKVGSVLFGSGYVLLAFLRADLVDRWGWLTETELLDAVAIGQLTPGPLSTTATFIGYLLGGFPGAGVATAGMFLPAFFFVAISGPLIPRLRRSPTAGAILDGVNVAALALMAVVTARLAQAALIDPLTVVLALLSSAVLFRFRINSGWLILAGGLVGPAVERIAR